jgi:hypothetical protein
VGPLERARQLYEDGQLDTALIAIREICAHEPTNAEAWWMLGCISRHAGMIGISDDSFRRAAQLLPIQRPVPHRVSAQHFQELVDDAKRVINESAATGPGPVVDAVRNLPQTFAQALPDSAASRRWGVFVPGLSEGVRLVTQVKPLPSREAVTGGLSPDARWSYSNEVSILLYQINHENRAGSDRDLVHLLVRSLIFASGRRG